MKHVFDDGGRALAGYRGNAGDCVVRAIAIATKTDYQKIYDELNLLSRKIAVAKRTSFDSSSRTGHDKLVYTKYLESIGWKWVVCSGIGLGCKVHLKEDELPMGRIIVRLSGHLAAVIDHVIHDTYKDDRNGTRMVYGYFKEPSK